jgi:hypothetical protein
MSMQMDAYLKKEHIGTLFALVGAPEGGFRGGAGGSSPKSIRAFQKEKDVSCSYNKKALLLPRWHRRGLPSTHPHLSSHCYL